MQCKHMVCITCPRRKRTWGRGREENRTGRDETNQGWG